MSAARDYFGWYVISAYDMIILFGEAFKILLGPMHYKLNKATKECGATNVEYSIALVLIAIVLILSTSNLTTRMRDRGRAVQSATGANNGTQFNMVPCRSGSGFSGTKCF